MILAGVATLDLRSLTSAEGLLIPAGAATLDLRSLTSAEAFLRLPAGAGQPLTFVCYIG